MSVLATTKRSDLMPILQIAPRGVARVPFIIRSGNSQSDAKDIGGWEPVALQFVLPWTTADITFLAAEKFDGTYLPVYGPSAVEAKITTGTNAKVIMFTPGTIGDLDGLRYLKLRSGTEASPVNQAGDRTVNMIVRQGA